MSQVLINALSSLNLSVAEASVFSEGVEDYFLRVSQEAAAIDWQVSDAQRRKAELQPRLAAAQTVAEKLGIPWPNPNPPPPPAPTDVPLTPNVLDAPAEG